MDNHPEKKPPDAEVSTEPEEEILGELRIRLAIPIPTPRVARSCALEVLPFRSTRLPQYTTLANTFP